MACWRTAYPAPESGPIGALVNVAELLADGDYQPLEVTGRSSEHLCAFMRSHGEKRLVVTVPRLVHRLYRDGAADWGATTLALPAGSWRDVLTGGRLDGGVEVPVSRLLADFPVAVLSDENDARATTETGLAVDVAAERCTPHLF